MARRISDKVDMSYRQSMLIARTEAHRVRETGLNDAANEVDDILKANYSDYRKIKIWNTLGDAVVRDTHSPMDNVVVLQDEKFELPSGATADCPGTTGIASEDCNCRCFITHDIVTDEEFYALTGRHFKENNDNSQKQLTASGDSGIVDMGTLGNATQLGVNHADAMETILDSAPKSVQKVWNKYANRLKVVDAHASSGTAYYSAATNGVTFNIDDISKGEKILNRNNVWEQAVNPYETAFHEFGHNISALSAKDITGQRGDISISFRSKKYSGYTLNEMIKEEGNNYVNAVWSSLKQQAKSNGLSAKTVRKQDAWNYIKQEILNEPVLVTADVSDMWSGISKNACRPHYGHRTAYWNSVEVGEEAFAEMFSATVMNADSVKQMQRYFPKSYDLFLEILGEIGV